MSSTMARATNTAETLTTPIPFDGVNVTAIMNSRILFSVTVEMVRKSVWQVGDRCPADTSVFLARARWRCSETLCVLLVGGCEEPAHPAMIAGDCQQSGQTVREKRNEPCGTKRSRNDDPSPMQISSVNRAQEGNDKERDTWNTEKLQRKMVQSWWEHSFGVRLDDGCYNCGKWCRRSTARSKPKTAV